MLALPCDCCNTTSCHKACGCFLTDSLGLYDSALSLSVPLTYNPVPQFFSDPEWSGTASYTYPGDDNCPARTVILTYFFHDCAVAVFWETVGDTDGPDACPEPGPWTGSSVHFHELDVDMPDVFCGAFSTDGSVAGSGSADTPQGALYGVGVGTTIAVAGTPADPGDCPVGCSPCSVPSGSITLSWSGGTFGAGSLSLTYSETDDGFGDTFFRWTGTTTFHFGTPGVDADILFTIQCYHGSLSFSAQDLSGFLVFGDCEWPAGSSDFAFFEVVADRTCGPLHLHYNTYQPGFRCNLFWCVGCASSYNYITDFYVDG